MHRIKIESLAYGGYGVARIDGEVCFVPYGVPGDELLIQIKSKHKGVNWADILEIYEPSPHRREPPCPLFQKCGGCQWLHIDDSAQLEWKKQIVEDAFKRIGKFQFDEIEIVEDGARNLGYRTRAQFHFEFSDSKLKFGFHEPSSHGIVDFDQCPLLFEGINNLIPSIKEILRESGPLKFLSSLRIVMNPVNGNSLLWLDLAGEDESKARQICEKLLKLENVVGVDYRDSESPSMKTFELNLPGCVALVTSGSFAQPSFFHNEMLVNLILELAGDVWGKRVLDIYSGWGNLSLPMGAKGAMVRGFDSDPDAINAANMSAFKNKFENCVYKKSMDSNLARKIERGDEKADIIILDPPRTGAKAISSAIARSSAKKIIYVSCDPNTLARDLRMMTDAGREHGKTYVLNMIPQTYHIETVNILE